VRKLFLLEPDDPGPLWIPWTGARPVAELRAGAFKIWERWARALDLRHAAVYSSHTHRFADVGSLPQVGLDALRGPAIVARSTFAPIARAVELPRGVRGLSANGLTVAWLLEDGESWAGPNEVVDPIEIKGLRLAGAYDLVTACERLLEDDCATALHDVSLGVPAGSVVLGDPGRVVALTASVEPHVVFDVRKGPIVLEPDVVVRAGTRLEGPLYVSRHTWLLGGAIRHSAIGPHCRVHGEVSASVFLGYANKSHDGFIGHSVIGHWANLGAGTITSNLKNTYGEVRLDLPDTRIATGRTNLGTLMGDHAKSAIGTLFPTGAVIGTGANVNRPPVPKFVRPFAWDGTGARLDRARFLTVAGRVMPRRGVDLTPEVVASLEAIHERLAR
jgi:UDP-N-acetylglucosamine diphosphorylase/glucosamine-1-phosphate N-acetyltransferase